MTRLIEDVVPAELWGRWNRLDWTRASIDSLSVRAKRGGTTWAQIQSIVARLEASCIWSATAAGSR
jgi:hypothetical protein